MSTLILTLGIAFVVVLVALAIMGISWLLTGKLKLRPGACGRDPKKIRDEEEGCGTSANCHLCKRDDEECNSDEKKKP